MDAYVRGVEDIDLGENTFFMEGFLDMIWCDTRVAYNKNSPTKHINHGNNKKHIYLEMSAAKKLEELWWPDLAFMNKFDGKRIIENQDSSSNRMGRWSIAKSLVLVSTSPSESDNLSFSFIDIARLLFANSEYRSYKILPKKFLCKPHRFRRR